MSKAARTKNVFFITLLSIIFVFMLGIFVGRWVGSSNLSQIDYFIKENELNTESYILEQEMISGIAEGDCSAANIRINSLSEDLWKIGQSLSPSDAEERLGSENYNFLKRKYHLLQIRTYTLLYKIKQECQGTASSVILYYFSRNDPDSGKQGEILDRIVDDFGANVFAIEYSYSPELSFLEEYYGITGTPAVVINYGSAHIGIASYEEISAEIAANKNK